MTRTPDRFPGTREEDELQLEPESSDPTTVGAVRNVSGYFRFRDNDGVHTPLGRESARHGAVRHLIHFMDEGPGDGFASGHSKRSLAACSQPA